MEVYPDSVLLLREERSRDRLRLSSLFILGLFIINANENVRSWKCL